MYTKILFSGSQGNSTLVSDGNTKILIDAGGCEKNIKARLEEAGERLENISAILITHEHTDHTKALFTIAKNFSVPTYTTLETAREICSDKKATRQTLESVARLVRTVSVRECYEIGSLTVTPFHIPHDAASPLGFRVVSEEKNKTLTYATDTGCVTRDMLEFFEGCDAAVIEANHDRDMLINGSYPEFLKQRILSDKGHLSNETASRFALWLMQNGTKKITLAHLSRDNNTPEIALAGVCERLSNNGFGTQCINVACQFEPVEVNI
jgi:phosphoribosyl 1,2-cyclic phosphodiesterase